MNDEARSLGIGISFSIHSCRPINFAASSIMFFSKHPMKHRILRIILLITASSLLQSCIVPYPRFTQRSPSVVGRAVDAKNMAPIPNAKVSGAKWELLEWQWKQKPVGRHNPVKPTTITKADGTFRLPSSHNFLLTKVFFAPCSGSLGDQTGESIYLFMVKAEGYEPLVFARPEDQKTSFDAGDLKMIPLRYSR